MASKTDIEIARGLRELVNRIRRNIRKQVSLLGLSATEENVVRILIQQQEVLPSELCKRLNHSSQFMSQVLNRLEELDYIVRKPSQEDKRKVLVSLSKQGGLKVDNLRQEKDEWLASLISAKFTAQEKESIKHAVALLAGLPEL